MSMKENAMTNMQETFAKALIAMLDEKPLADITVKDIAGRCGVSRQSFYYYFGDIFGLIEWIFVRETEKALEEFSDIDSWTTGFVRIMKRFRSRHAFVLSVYSSVQRDQIELFMYRVLYQYMIRVVDTEASGLRVTEDQKAFIANFYTLSLNAVMLDWIKKGMVEEPLEVAEKVSFLIEGDFRKALLRFQEKNRLH